MKLLFLLLFIGFACSQIENMTYEYTFYNGEGLLTLFRGPVNCYPMVGTTIEIDNNQTYNCDKMLDQNGAFTYVQMLDEWPYVRIFDCNINPGQYYYMISECAVLNE